MCLSTKLRFVCLGIVCHSLCGSGHFLRADDQRIGAAERVESEPVTVAGVFAALDISELPRPKDAKSIFSDTKTVIYETSDNLNNALVSVSDEFLKRSFTAEDSIRTRMATITIKHQDRPMTIWMMNSLDEPLTHVSMHHHQGIDISIVPRLRPAGPVDERVDEIFYTTEVGVWEGQSLLRSQISEKNLEIARMSASNGIARRFVKAGVAFVVHVEDSQSQEFEMRDEGGTKSVRVHISSRGNFDDLNLPLPDDFEENAQPYNAIFGVRKYFTTSSPAAAVKRAARELQQIGWTPVDPIRESVSDRQRLLIFNGALVQVGAKAFGKGRTHVDYVVSMLPFDLPPEIETRIVRVDTASSNLFFTTSADVQQVTDFYKVHLPTIGWESKPDRLTDKPAEYRQLFARGPAATVVLNVRSKGDDSTWVELAPVGSASLDQVVQADVPSEDVPSEDVQLEMERRAAIDATAPPAAAELRSNLETEGLPTTPEAIMALAESQLESALQDVPADQAAMIRQMIKSELSSTLQLQTADTTDSLPDEVDRVIPVEPPAQKTPPAGKLAAADFPVPAGAQKVSRDFEMITFGVDQIATHAKTIHQALVALGWKPRGEQMVETDYAYLKFQKGTGTINVTLVLDDRRDPPVHVVVQGDGLWFPGSDEFAGEFSGEPADFDPDVEMEFEGQEDSFESSDDSFADDDSATEFEGLALPDGIDSEVKMSSQFRNETTTSIESDLKSMVEFFRIAAKEGNWKTIDEKIGNQKATLTLVGSRGEMLVNLQQYDGEIEIHLALRNTELAKQYGFFPKQGLGKLMLANASEAKVEIVINGKSYKLDPLQGAEDPRGSIQLNVRPGRYNYTIKGAGREEQSDKLSVVIGGTWAVMVLPERGHMAEQMY